jgi:hypothetical protein
VLQLPLVLPTFSEYRERVAGIEAGAQTAAHRHEAAMRDVRLGRRQPADR